MSNGPGPINLTRLASASLKGGHAPLPGSGESAKTENAKFKPITEHTVVKRTIPVTDYKPPGQEEPEVVEPAADPAAIEATRHEKWKAAQEAKRTARVAQAEAAAKARQATASELLRKQDLPGAAKALGIPVSELVTLVNHGAMGIKPEETLAKEQTPQEKFEADQIAFRKEMADFKAEQVAHNNARAMASFIEANLRPVLADKDAYEMIHAAGATDIETYAYRYMNEHYFETSEKGESGKIVKPGEILNAKDVLDAIEENLVKNAEATVERNKGLKKLAKHFAPVGGDVAAEDLGAELTKAPSSGLNDARRAQIAKAMAEELAAAQGSLTAEEEPEQPVADGTAQATPVRAGGANIRAIRPGRLTAAEKLAKVKADEAAEARAALFGKGARR